MKKIIFYLSIFIFSCSSNETNEVINKISFKKVNYITLTNETNDGAFITKSSRDWCTKAK